MTPRSEAAIQAEILVAVTALPDACFWRQNIGSAQNPATGRVIRFGRPGAPDILGCYRGKAVGIECKTAAGRLRKTQEIWREAFERAGGLYIIGRDVDGVLRGLGVSA